MTLYTRPGTGQWIPEGVIRSYVVRERPEVGAIVAYEFAAWRVMDVRDSEMTPEEAEYVSHFTPKYRAECQPYRIQLRRMHGPKHERENSAQDLALRTSVNFRGWDQYQSDRVPLCSCCGHPWPCRMSCAEEQAKRSAHTMSERMDRIQPGACYGCGEQITPRQGSVVMPESNIDIPGAPAPRFHTRQKCAEERRGYEQRREQQLGQPIETTQEQLP